jgi:hypothetical protein
MTTQSAGEIQLVFRNPFTANWWLRMSAAGSRKKRRAAAGQQLQRRECFQIQAASYPKPCSRLISPQGKFHSWAIESVNLFVIEATTGQRDLSRKHHIALHGGRSSLEWGAGKRPSSG